jgi:hypothetical protein
LTGYPSHGSLFAMAAPLTRGDLLWTGQHWIAYLRRPGEQEHTGAVSLYRAAASPAGSGTAAFVDIPGPQGFTGLCADNRAFGDFARTQAVATSPFDIDMAVVDAELSSAGDMRTAPGWQIVAGDRRIEVTWSDLDAPLVGPPTLNPAIVFTVLVFAGRGSIHLDGREVGGEPYLRDGWARTLGTPRSSCCFALAETTLVENDR